MYTDNENMENPKKISFLEIYLNDISPKLKQIDLLIKTTTGSLSLAKVARTLDLNEPEIKNIMTRLRIKKIDRRSFFIIMYHGSSNICRLYRRELECGSPPTYTRKQISYIYGLNQEEINKVCDKLHIIEATAFTLPDIFAEIQVNACTPL